MVEKRNIYCVIMAGGIGSRFWPLSRASKPKQFLDILGTGSTLLKQTWDRLTKVCEPQNILVVTGRNYKDIVLEQIPEILPEQILLEPMRRNTAPCIAFANSVIKKRNPNAVVVVAPSDHLIIEQDKFIDVINLAIEFASKNEALLTIGIKPTRPETGYGYIQISDRVKKESGKLFKVKTFTEKPNIEMAKIFIESGEFYWNSGIFIWAANAISKAFDSHLPDIYQLFEGVNEKIGTDEQDRSILGVYSDCKSISIDYGILEKAQNVFVICSEFGWSDLGTWGSLYQNSKTDKKGNVLIGKNVLTYNVSNSIINISDDKILIAEGIDGYIVAESNGVILICKRENEQEIKRYQNDVLLEKGNKFI